MTQNEIIGRLKDAMQTSSQEANVNWDTVTAETSIEEIGFDSLSILDLIYDIQQVFGIEFEAEEMVSIDTVGALAEFIENEMQA